MYSVSEGVRWIDAAATQGIVTMNYNRYWDLHLCSSTFTAEDKQDPRYDFFTHRGTEYRYDFLGDMQRQGDYREAKAEGYESGAWATLMSRANATVLDSSELTHSQKSFLLPSTQGGISEELSRLRYVGCLVSIERLSDGNTYPQLQSLVRWISDANTINKLRINCHGSGKSRDGFQMGGKLSPEDLVDALVRHGLSIGPKAKNLAGLAHAARWKRDNEVTECEGSCTPKTKFSFTRRRHHCRRCGGIFCDTCSSWKVDLDIALAGESDKTVTNVKNARVCANCFKDAWDHKLTLVGGEAVHNRALTDRETKYGLKQITLGLCLGAVSDDGFSLERGTRSTNARAQAGLPGFVSGSLACRLIEALRQRGLRGIKITASNQVVSGSTGCIQNQLLVEFPRGRGLIPQPQGGLAQAQRGRHNFGKKSDFDFPAKVWGESDGLKGLWDVCATGRPADIPNSSEISLHSANPRSLVFGGVGNDRSAFRFLKYQFFANWRFTGWVEKEEQSFSAPSSGARGNGVTIIITPPDRVTNVEVKLKNNEMRVFLAGRPAGEELFKWYKSYDES
jgi:hypothetical protein